MVKNENEAKILLHIFKDIEEEYNSNSLSKVIGISAMGTLKLLKKLEKEGIVISRKIGNSFIYKVNLKKEYALSYIEFLLKSEAEKSPAYIKRWINEFKNLNEAEFIILFGSVLKIHEKAKDIDILFVIKKRNFKKLKKQIEIINSLNDKNIHAIFQTEKDFKKNLIKKDKVLLNAIKGIVVSGSNKFISIMKNE